jgi:cobaltochelatase CobS
MSERITCQICGEQVHAIIRHLPEQHPEWTVERYKAEYPAAPLLSEAAKQTIKKQRSTAAPESKSPVTSPATGLPEGKGYLHEVFDLGAVPAALSASGKPVPISVLGTVEGEYGSNLVPVIDKDYVFNIDTLKTLLMCLEQRLPILLWGHMGTGKTSLIEQACARTLRPAIRVNHTLNTEEAHILGQHVYRNSATLFQPGWLPIAMRYGLTYIADEYDFAVPHVLSVYQSVLEGKPLVIKDADPEWRVVEPHPNFRFCATGNTNGTGDGTGIYQGTQLQNAANYERFAVVQKVEFMDATIEKRILTGKTGISSKDGDALIKFAQQIRAECDKSQISTPITPRSLLNAARIGVMKGDLKQGLMLAYINRLTPVEAEIARAVAQRHFS